MVGKERTVMYDDMQLVEKVRVYEPGEDTRASGHGDDKGVLAYGPGTISIPSLSAHEPLRAECDHRRHDASRGRLEHALASLQIERPA